MAKGRELKGRIKSVENTRKITRTLEMVATSKLKRTQDRVGAARPYAQALRDVIASLYSPDLAEQFPLLRQPAKAKRAAVMLMTANRGLAGAFNANLIKEARATIARLEREGVEVDIHAVGRKGLGYFRYIGRKVASSRTDIGDRPTAANAAELVNDLTAAFARGEHRRRVCGVPEFQVGAVGSAGDRSGAPGDSAVERREAPRLHPRPGRAGDSRRAAAAVRAQLGVSRAGRNDRRVLRRPAHRDEERDGQRR